MDPPQLGRPGATSAVPQGVSHAQSGAPRLSSSPLTPYTSYILRVLVVHTQLPWRALLLAAGAVVSNS